MKGADVHLRQSSSLSAMNERCLLSNVFSFLQKHFDCNSLIVVTPLPLRVEAGQWRSHGGGCV